MEMLADSVDPQAAPCQLSLHALECVQLRKKLDWVTQWLRRVRPSASTFFQFHGK